MRIHRRQFLKYCVGSAAAMSLPMSVIGKLQQALAAGGSTLPKVIWLNAANCTGCTVSLANLFSDSGPTDVADLLLNTIDLAFHPNLMGGAGDLAVQQLHAAAQGSYILAVEGGIPTAFDGGTCLLWSEQGKDVTAMEAVQMLAPNAAAILSIGTCASFGGIPGSTPNPTGIVSVGDFTGLPIVNIPGCPTHPDWIVWVIAHLLAGETPVLDEFSRPTELYGESVHRTCPRRGQEDTKIFGTTGRCLRELGCKGPRTGSDCPSRKWNSGTNWCIEAESICVGCTESGFPDSSSPFYNVEYSYELFEKPAPEEPNPGDPQPEPEPEPEPTDGSLQITKAQWDAKKSRIEIEGTGDSGRIVTVSDADSGIQLGAVSVDRRGTWKLRVKNPSPIPVRLQAVSGGQTALFAVAGIPAAGGNSDNDRSGNGKRDRRDTKGERRSGRGRGRDDD